MFKDLTNAKLAIRFGPVLYLHGALPLSFDDDAGDDQSICYPTPWIHPKDGDTDAGCRSLSDWISALNNFASSQVEGWKAFRDSRLRDQMQHSSGGVWAAEGGYFNDTASGKLFGALMQFGMGTLPDRSKTQSCVYSSWMHDGLPRDDLFGSDESMRKLRELFRREGIEVIFTGHQPVGDAPWPIQISGDYDESKLWIIPCDTSFSGDTLFVSPEGYDSKQSESFGRGSAKRGRGEVAFRLVQLMIQLRLFSWR